MNGIERIALERQRQGQKGYNTAHDALHSSRELAWLATYYAMPHPLRIKCHCGASSFVTPDSMFEQTGFDPQFARRGGKTHRERMIVAGALAAAEIDRDIAEGEKALLAENTVLRKLAQTTFNFVQETVLHEDEANDHPLVKALREAGYEDV